MKKAFSVLIILMLVAIPAVSAENWFSKLLGFKVPPKVVDQEEYLAELGSEATASGEISEGTAPEPIMVEPGRGGRVEPAIFKIPCPEAIPKHDIFRLDIGETQTLRSNNNGCIDIKLLNIEGNKAEIEYIETDYDGQIIDEQHYFAGIEDMGFATETLKLTENKVLLVIPHFIN